MDPVKWDIATTVLPEDDGSVWFHPNEEDRLESLHSYQVLDTPAEPSYDGAVRLAAAMCGTPVALVSFVAEDRQWFKAAYGFGEERTQTSRQVSFCSDAVATGQPLTVGDAQRHPRYASNALVTGDPRIRAYAGVPLVGRDGLPLGTLCVIDWRPRRFTTAQLEALKVLAAGVVAQLELRRADHRAGLHPDTLLADATDPLRLRRALDRDEFTTRYQPIVDLRTGRTVALEALLRWEHPDLGVLPPALFLQAIESSLLILPVGRQVIDAGVALAARIGSDPAARSTPTMAVNISGAQLRTPGLADTVFASLDHHALPARRLCLELTETFEVDHAIARSELHQLHDAGVHLSLDDYGAGLSTVGQLLDLPITGLKLDRSIIAGLPSDPRGRKITVSTLQLAGEMGLSVVCEGIETTDQRDLLVNLGAIHGQGWLYGRPVPAAVAAANLADPARVRPAAGRDQTTVL